jgi:hypothetical protein
MYTCSMLGQNDMKPSLWIVALLFGAALAQTAQANQTFDFSFMSIALLAVVFVVEKRKGSAVTSKSLIRCPTLNR